MSVAILNQVYDEVRRIAVAGSVVAPGDFRLKKLLAPLEQAGAKAPVFAKVAENTRALVDGPEDASAERLLELTSLVTAVLYTQGETGQTGKREPIETSNLGGEMVQTSARLLKPLLEALSSTGSGRLGLIQEAQQRNAFRDLRLVKPALAGLDDPYPEIADFLAETVLPQYGKAIWPELRAKYDPKGTKGHPRRLKLMHALDPVATREIVKQALDEGAKEVKVAAISCLGAAKEDLSYLLEQASAKSQDVRGAAYGALAVISDPAAVAVLEKAITGKDLDLAAEAISRSQNSKLTDVLVAEIRRAWDALPKLKDKKLVSEHSRRLIYLIRVLPEQEHATADAITLELFQRRAELAKAKGDVLSGSDVVEAVISRMVDGPKPLQLGLARAHAELDADNLAEAFEAARQVLSAKELYEMFSPYLAGKSDEKKKGKDPSAAKRDAMIDALDGNFIHYWRYHDPDKPLTPLDPKWLELAVKLQHLGLIHAVGTPGHKGAEAVVQAEFDSTVKKPRSEDHLRDVVSVMVHLQHPNATTALLTAFEKLIGKANSYPYWYIHLVPELPKSAIPQLEAIVPKLKDHLADQWVAAIQELREKKS